MPPTKTVKKATKKVAPWIEVLPIKRSALPDAQNINLHTEAGRDLHKNSLAQRGANRSIASAGKGVRTPQITAGNQTFVLAQEIGIEEVINIYTDGTQLVNVVRTDIKPGSPEAIALGIEDNEIGARSYNPDFQMLAGLVNDDSLFETLRESDPVFSSLLSDMNIQNANLFADSAGAAEREEEKQEAADLRHEQNGGDGIYAFTIPCTKPERDQIIEILNLIKQTRHFDTSTAALLYALKGYQDANSKKKTSK